MSTSTWVWTCTGTRGQKAAPASLSGEFYPTCTPQASASWVQVEASVPFDVATLNTSQLADAFGAGFIVMATGVLIAGAVRMIIKAVKEF